MSQVLRRFLRGLDAEVSALGAGCWATGGPATNREVPIGWDDVDPERAYTGPRRMSRPSGSQRPGSRAHLVRSESPSGVPSAGRTARPGGRPWSSPVLFQDRWWPAPRPHRPKPHTGIYLPFSSFAPHESAWVLPTGFEPALPP
jgi:hypothetical protein